MGFSTDAIHAGQKPDPNMGDYVTTPSTGGDITDVGQNIIGITYLFKLKTQF